MVFAMAAMVALASCSKTELVDNSAPTPISFKAVTGFMTKAEQVTTLTGTMGVYAFVNDTKVDYFSNVAFSNSGTENFGTDAQPNELSIWTGNQYWPLQSSLDFVVYAPQNPTTGQVSYANNVLTVMCDNSGAVESSYIDIDDQTDFLYGAEYFDGEDGNDSDTNPDGYNKDTPYVPVTLKHALSKITFNFSGENVTVNSVSITNPNLKGTYTVDYSTSTPEADWISTISHTGDLILANSSFDFTSTSTSNTTTTEVMVVPGNVCTITINYTIEGTLTDLDYVITPTNGAKWDSGNNYVYDITIGPKEIKFVPTVDPWGQGPEIDVPIN